MFDIKQINLKDLRLKDLKLTDVKNQKLIIFTVLILLAVFIGYNFIYKPTNKKIIFLKQTLNIEKKRSDILNEAIVLKNKQRLALSKFFDQPSFTWFINYINEIAKASSIIISSIKPLPQESVKGYVRLTINLDLEGTYRQLCDFVEKIENSERFMTINRINFKKKALSKIEIKKAVPEEEPILEISLEMSGFSISKESNK